MATRIGSRCGASTGSWAITVTSRLTSAYPAASHEPADLLEEDPARDAAPPRVAAREVAAHVALPRRPEERVADRVQDAVAVGVALEAAAVGHLDPAEEERAPGHQAVGVEAVADAQRRSCADEPREDALGPGEVLRRRDLAVARRAGHGAHRRAQPLDRHGLVGHGDAVAERRLVGLDEEREAEALRRLRRAELLAVERLDHEAVAHALHGVDHRAATGRAAPAPRRLAGHGLDERDVHEGAGRVVHEDDAVEAVRGLPEALEDRVLPPLAARHHRDELAHRREQRARGRRPRPPGTTATIRAHRRRRVEDARRAQDERLPGELEEGLGAADRPCALRGRRRRGWRATACDWRPD